MPKRLDVEVRWLPKDSKYVIESIEGSYTYVLSRGQKLSQRELQVIGEMKDVNINIISLSTVRAGATYDIYAIPCNGKMDIVSGSFCPGANTISGHYKGKNFDLSLAKKLSAIYDEHGTVALITQSEKIAAILNEFKTTLINSPANATI